MSADNWTTCPRCVAEAEQQHAAEVARVQALYGHVPVEEFDTARAAIEEVDRVRLCTFREDYEFYGADEGEVRAEYSGGCQSCGLTVRLNETKRFWPEDGEQP